MLYQYYLWSIVSAHPSTTISCVAARKLRQKKKHVRTIMLGEWVLEWSGPNQSSTLPERKIIKTPMRYCAGTSHDFLLPNRDEKNESTIGAHISFTLNGQWTKLNSACGRKENVLLVHFKIVLKTDINRNIQNGYTRPRNKAWCTMFLKLLSCHHRLTSLY